MALNKNINAHSRTRFVKMTLVIVEELTPLLQDILENDIAHGQIFHQVSHQKTLFQKLRPEQITLIQNAQHDGYKKFDITLLCTLLRNLGCPNVTAPTHGWGKIRMPRNGETTVGDDIERIRLIRNKVLGHAATASLSETEFKEHWSNIAGICSRMDTLLGKKYLDRLLYAEMRAIDLEMENTYLEIINDLCISEKSTRELLDKVMKNTAPRAEETLRIEARDPLNNSVAETLTDASISILNDLKDAITESTSESEIEFMYEVIEEFFLENMEEASLLISFPFFEELKQKITRYAYCKQNPLQILARHLRFLLVLKKKYRAAVEISNGSLLMKLAFSSEKDYDLYMQDKQRGEIEKQILSVVYYPPYLANFNLKADDLTAHLVDNTAEISTSPSHKPGFSATQISSITVPGVRGVQHICDVTSDRLWVSGLDGSLLQVDSTGHVTHDKLRGRPRSWLTGSHTVTENGDLLFIDDDDKVCKLTSDGTVTTLLTTNRITDCIHSSRINGDILVGRFNGRVTRYDRTGRELQVIERDDKGHNLYGTPKYTTENQNGDIWTSDVLKEAVVVVDKSGRHRFNYTGRQSDYAGRQSEDAIDSACRQSPFSPHGICTDDLGHALVCDAYNDSVHLLDQDGQFLTLLLTRGQHGIHRPTAVCVDDQHNLYLGQRISNTIYVYKYLQDTDVK